VSGFKCECPDDVDIGAYGNQIFVHSPPHMPKSNGYCLDRCVAEEVMALWQLGVRTTGCCCGHRGVCPAFIGVHDDHIFAMKTYGYSVVENHMRPGDEDSFFPMGRDHAIGLVREMEENHETELG
jgi:hypothetical protein